MRKFTALRLSSLAVVSFVVCASAAACKKDDPPPQTPPTASQQPYGQPGQPGYGQPGQPGYGQPGTYPSTTGQPGAAPMATGGAMATPGPAALPCQNDSQCMTHRCNTQFQKCAFPCQTDADCIQGATCFVGGGAMAACIPKPPGQ